MDLQNYQKDKSIGTKEIISELKTKFPKYGKAVHSMVVNGDTYGVRLHKRAEAMITARWGGQAEKKHNRAKPRRAILSLNADMENLLAACIKSSGKSSCQDFLWSLVLNYAAENHIEEEP